MQPVIPPIQQTIPETGPVPLLNWFYSESELLGKPDEDAEQYLLRRTNCMDTNGFLDGVKVQRFCLTLASKDRL